MNLVVGLTLLLGICVVSCSGSGKKDEKSEKCPPSESEIEITKKCFKDVVGKDIGGPDDAKTWESEDKTKIIACIFVELKVIDDGGFNLDNAEKAILEMNADDETKDALIEGMRKCSEESEKEDVEKILGCVEEETRTVCGDF